MDSSEKQFTKEKFLQAIDSLFKSNDSKLQREGNNFLCLFSQTPESFEISLDVLNTPNLIDEAYFNASQTLNKKLQFDFGNYFENPQLIFTLLKFLVEQIDKFQKSKQYIRVNLCQCFSRAMLFSADNFNQVMQYCVNKLSVQNSLENNLSLLMIFDFLPETYFDNEIVVDDDSKKVFIRNLDSIEQDVMIYLNSQIKLLNTKINSGEQLYIQNKCIFTRYILETLINWLNLHLNDETIKKFENEYIDIINYVFVIDELMEKHAECICLLLQLPLEIQDFQNLAKIIFSKVMQYKDIIYRKEEFDEIEAGYYIKIFTALCTYNMEQIFTERRFDIFQLLVDLSKYCPSSRIEDLCDFWLVLFQHLYSIKITTEASLIQFKDLYIQFIVNTLKLIQFNDELFIHLNKQKTSSLKHDEDYLEVIKYRKTIQGALNQFAREYGFNFIYDNIIYPQFMIVVSEIKAVPTSTSLWSRFESLLFMFMCVCNKLPSGNDLSVYEPFFDTIFDIPKELMQIIRTFSDTLEKLKEHLKNNPRLLLKSFEFLMHSINNSPITDHCIQTATKLMLSNKEIFYQNKSDLMKLYHSTFESKILLHEKYRVFVEGIVELFCYSRPENTNTEEIKANLSELLNTWVNYLNEVNIKINNQPKDIPFAEKDLSVIVLLLSVIKIFSRAMVSGLSEENNFIMSEIFKTLWPKIINIVKYFSTNIDIVEQTMQITKHFMRKMKNEFNIYLQEYTQLIIEGYKSSPISSYIYGFEILLTVFSKDENFRAVLDNLFSEIFNITFNNYLTSPDISEEYIDLGFDFFGMLGRLMKLNPFLFLDSQFGAKVIEVSIQFMTTTQIEVAKNIIGFLNNLVDFEKFPKYYTNPIEIKLKITNLLSLFSDELVKQALNIFYCAPPLIIAEELQELINNFILFSKDMAYNSFQKHLGCFPSDCLTDKEKEFFLKTIKDYNENIMYGLLEKLIKRCGNKQIRNKKF